MIEVDTIALAGLLPVFGCFNILAGVLLTLHYLSAVEDDHAPPTPLVEGEDEADIPEVESRGEYVTIRRAGEIVGGYYK